MDDNNSKPKPKTQQDVAKGSAAKASSLTPEEREDLRRRIIEQLDESAEEVDLNDEEEQVLFHLAYKAG